jgi:hypothetical protein
MTHTIDLSARSIIPTRTVVQNVMKTPTIAQIDQTVTMTRTVVQKDTTIATNHITIVLIAVMSITTNTITLTLDKLSIIINSILQSLNKPSIMPNLILPVSLPNLFPLLPNQLLWILK